MSDDLEGFEDLFEPGAEPIEVMIAERFKAAFTEHMRQNFCWSAKLGRYLTEDEFLYGTGTNEPLGIIKAPPLELHDYQKELWRKMDLENEPVVTGIDLADGPDKTAWIDVSNFAEVCVADISTGATIASVKSKDVEPDKLLEQLEHKIRESQPYYRPWKPWSERRMHPDTYEYLTRHKPKASPIILARR